MTLADYRAEHFRWSLREGVGCITLDRPERKNPLTFESYAELRDLFRRLEQAPEVRAVLIGGAGGNFCSGGDVHEIIGPLVGSDMPALLRFTRMTGDLVKAMRACPQPVVAAIDGVCVGAGAMSRWRPICVTARSTPRWPSSSCASAWPAATWAPVPCCRG